MKKISKTKIAVTYATALYEAAVSKNVLEIVRADVAKLIDVLKNDADFIKYMANPILDDKFKQEVLSDVAAKLKWSNETLRCLDIIVENQRFNDLSLILEKFMHIYYQKFGIAEVEVESVKALSAAQDKKLQSVLETVLSKKVLISYKMVPELIGGLRIKFGSQMIDDSIESKLKRLENVMKGGQ